MVEQLDASHFNMRTAGHNFRASQQNSTKSDVKNLFVKLNEISVSKRLYLQRLASTRMNRSELSKTSCVTVFATPVSNPVWLPIDCLQSFESNWFVCEYAAIPLHNKQTYLYHRKEIFCQRNMVHIIGKCWHISLKINTKVVSSHIDRELLSMSSMLTSWSLANTSRYSIRVSGDPNHGCLEREGFEYQRLVSWRYKSNCTHNKHTMHYLVSSNARYFKHPCKLPSHFRCNDSTCILSSYVCDGYTDCSDNSDELNCTDVCTHANNTCYHACVPTACVCSEMYYRCISHECIPLSFLCDNWQHCKDASDEHNCHVGMSTPTQSLDTHGSAMKVIIL